MHNQISIKQSFQNKRQWHWLDAPGLVLILSNVNILVTWRLWIFEHPLDFLLRLNFHFQLCGGLSYLQNMANIKVCNAWGAKV
jgi:hypothetical protein